MRVCVCVCVCARVCVFVRARVCACVCVCLYQTPRPKWVLSWPGQVVIAGCQTYWSAEVTEALEKNQLEER